LPVIESQTNVNNIQTKEKEQITLASIKQAPKDVAAQETDSNIANTKFKVEELDLIMLEESLQIATEEQKVAIEPLQVQIALPPVQAKPARQTSKPVKHDTELAEHKPFVQDETYPSTINNNDLDSRTNTYQQLSYRQEIDKLTMNNGLYQASHAIRTTEKQAIKTDKLRFASLESSAPAVSLAAKPLNSINPVYPSLAKRRGIEMEVKVDFVIDRNGKVKDINFAQQSKLIYFKSAIRSAIRKWRFSPATINNRKVESKMSKIFSFSLQA